MVIIGELSIHIQGICLHASTLYLFIYLYFVILWLNEDEKLYDTVNCKDVLPAEDVDILDLSVGTECQVMYKKIGTSSVFVPGNSILVYFLKKDNIYWVSSESL